jgi:hypothetical protein
MKSGKHEQNTSSVTVAELGNNLPICYMIIFTAYKQSNHMSKDWEKKKRLETIQRTGIHIVWGVLNNRTFNKHKVENIYWKTKYPRVSNCVSLIEWNFIHCLKRDVWTTTLACIT